MRPEDAELLELSPLGIVVCDKSQRATWCNSRFRQDTGLEESKIIGQLYLSLPFEAINKDGSKIQQFDESSSNANQFHHWQTEGGSDNLVIHYFILNNDITSGHSQLSKTKLPKRPNWVEFLDYEVSRSRRYDNPLCIMKLQLEINSNPDQLSDEDICQAIKDTLMDNLRWADMISNTKQNSFMMVLPETPHSSLNQLEQKLSSNLVAQLKYLSKGFECQIVFGHSYWQKHDDSQKLLARARENLVSNLEKNVSNQ